MQDSFHDPNDVQTFRFTVQIEVLPPRSWNSLYQWNHDGFSLHPLPLNPLQMWWKISNPYFSSYWRGNNPNQQNISTAAIENDHEIKSSNTSSSDQLLETQILNHQVNLPEPISINETLPIIQPQNTNVKIELPNYIQETSKEIASTTDKNKKRFQRNSAGDYYDLRVAFEEYISFPDGENDWKHNFLLKFANLKRFVISIYLCEDLSLLKEILETKKIRMLLILLNFKHFYSKKLK